MFHFGTKRNVTSVISRKYEAVFVPLECRHINTGLRLTIERVLDSILTSKEGEKKAHSIWEKRSFW